MTDIAAFTYRSARSGSLTAGLSLAVAVETMVVHLWLVQRHPGLTWGLTALSGATLAWLALEYRAMGRGTVRVETDALDVAIGRRAALRVPRTHVATAVPAAWRDVPDAPSPDYLNATAPADPNVLLTFAPPARVRLFGGLVVRSVTRLGLRLDDPAGFVAAVIRPSRPNEPLPLPPPGACEHRDGRPSALSSSLASRSGGQVARGQG